MTNIKITLPNKYCVSLSAIGSMTLNPDAVVIFNDRGELLTRLACPSNEIAVMTRDEITRVIESAYEGLPIEADFCFWPDDKTS